jgi:ABC-type Fe3+/spermidine/putrescine transport system ATPase subunit
VIRLEGIRLEAGSFKLRIDDLSLGKGEFLVILGPTGSGKTVLLETVAGLRPPQEGRIWFGDREVTHEPPERRRVGFVYQDYALFPHLTVARNIAFGLRARRRAWGDWGRGTTGGSGAAEGQEGNVDRVRRLASLLGIEPLLGRYPEGLSGGEQQRVALARALAIEPDVLLLDEPLSALDRQTRRELRGEIKRLHRELGSTVLHVTHDLDEALALGDRLAVLIEGSLRQVGMPADVIRRPADAEVARLLGLTNVFPVTWVAAAAGTAAADRRVRLVDGTAAGDPGAHRSGPGGGRELVVGSGSTKPAGDTFFAVVRPEEITLLAPGEELTGRQAAMGSPSANLMEGTIRDIQVQSVHASVEVDVPPAFTVHVLRPEVERMKLHVGSPVTLWVPPDSVHLCP